MSRKLDRRDQLAVPQHCVLVGPVPGQPVQVDDRNPPLPARTEHDHDRVDSGRATARSDGCTATHSGEAPRIALYRPYRSAAEQPLPGSRLLHGVVTSWK